MSNDILTLPNGPKCTKLITLLLQDNYNLKDIPDTFFQKVNLLRVLDVSRTQASTIPSSIKSLGKLRTLHLDRCEFADFSTLKSLKQLAILSLKESIMEEFPKAWGNLIYLRMLDLTLSLSIKILPNVLPSFCLLEELYMRGSFNLRNGGMKKMEKQAAMHPLRR